MDGGGNWFNKFIDWISSLFGGGGFLASHLIFITPISAVYVAGLVFALLRRADVFHRRFRWLLAGILLGLVYCVIAILYAAKADAALEAQDFETLLNLNALNLAGTFTLVASIAVLIRAALVREPKLDETS